MTGWLRPIWLALAVYLGLMAASPVSAAGLAALPALQPVLDCAALTGVDVSAPVGAKVTITSARLYPGAQPFCGVQGTIAPRIGFAVKLPTADWTQRYLQLGCGGLCGTVALHVEHDEGCAPVTGGHTVVASTDMGHSGRMGASATWGRDPQLRQDFAWRGVHLTALATKAIIRRYYGHAARYSYFMGCSDGGREALMEAQRFPHDFDGIAAGAPAMNFLVQNTFYHAWQARANTGPDGRYILTAAKLPALHRAALASCDAADGLKDGQITDPRLCRFDPAAAGCKPGQAASDDCLTPAEVAVARKFYDGPRDAEGHRFTIGGPQVGSELSWVGVYVPDAPDGRIMSPGAALDVIKYLAFAENPPETTTIGDFRFDQATFARLAALHPLYDATDTDLAPFERSGGKLILYHGWSDPHISPINTVAYYEGVEKVLGTARAHAFVRLFLFPGVYHCGGGDGPDRFGILTPLMMWVEGGHAPEVIVAGRQGGELPSAAPPGAGRGGAGGAPPDRTSPPDPFVARLGDRPTDASPAAMERTRPVFPYPLVARYDGKGSIDDAASFSAGPPLVAEGSISDWEGRSFIAPDTKR